MNKKDFREKSKNKTKILSYFLFSRFFNMTGTRVQDTEGKTHLENVKFDLPKKVWFFRKNPFNHPYGGINVYRYVKEGKTTEVVIYNYLFKHLKFIWTPNGWILKTTKPIPDSGSVPFRADMNLIWSCKDLYAYPAPGTKKPKEAE